jgi:hypothetical protein
VKFHETEQFKKQQREWYERLKETGFRDIEVLIGNEQKLMQYSRPYRDVDKLEYYQTLTHHFFQEKFENETHKWIMLWRSDGWKIREISERLKMMELSPSHRETVRYIIRRYEVKWNIKQYKPSQLSSKRGQDGRK